MKISIITATKNNKPGLLRAIECVRRQTYRNIEHIVVDGGSNDDSVEILRSKQKEINKGPVIPANEVRQESTADSGLRRNDTNSKKTEPLTSNYQLPTSNYQLLTISEPDDGIYDAINKGIKLATGDVIGLLHSDDLYADENVIKNYASAFDQPTTNLPTGQAGNQLQTIQAVYSDLVYVRLKSDSGLAGMTDRSTNNYQLSASYSTIRYWKTHKQEFTTEAQRHRALKNGWMPPHPTLFIRKEIFEKYGFYNTELRIASDYEMILRLLFKNQITSCYLPVTTYLMSIGGASNKSIGNVIIKSREDYTAMKRNGIPFPLFTLLCKNFRKLPQFLARDLS